MGKIRWRYIIIACVIIAASVTVAVVLPPLPDVSLVPVDGVGIFAILFVLAQAIERITHLLVPILDRIVGVGEKTASVRKDEALTLVRSASVAMRMSGDGAAFASVSKNAEDGEKELTAANAEKALLTNAVAFVFAAVGVALFNFSLLSAIGFVNVPLALDHVITATAIVGGTAGLGDLISKLQKSKTADEAKS